MRTAVTCNNEQISGDININTGYVTLWKSVLFYQIRRKSGAECPFEEMAYQFHKACLVFQNSTDTLITCYM